ncbi:MAG TPA: SusC/RagA family TonB-linked outer membrane protein [Gemmatimonadaceae bacterium]|jgi:TonB-linked SusC/RagA family outer membrane protein
MIAAGVVGASAQTATGTITGRVTDAGSGAPIGSSNIRVVGTQLGTQSGEDGKFTIRGVVPGPIDLQINHIGYEMKRASTTVTANGTATVNVTLSQAAFSLAEVVTTVTGTQSKAELSNTVATLDVASHIEELPVASTGQLLSGRAPGVEVQSAGAVGSGSRIRIRGQSSLSLGNDPLVYVDGIRVNASSSSSVIGTGGNSSSALDNISPEEIETIDVIKGPAAATLYGTEAANGVIVITTKKGKTGSTKWNAFSENGTLYNPYKGSYPDLWVAFDTHQVDSKGVPRVCTLISDAANTCTIDSVFHNDVLNDPVLTPFQHGNRAQYGLQMSGGNDKLQYFLSGDAVHEQGPYKMPDIEIKRLTAERGTPIGDDQVYPNADKQVNLRTNLGTQISPTADVSVSIGYVDRDLRNPTNEDTQGGIVVDALAGTARTDLKDARGVALLGYRSFPMGDVMSRVNTENATRFINGINARYYPLSWLNARANLGYDYTARNGTSLVRFNQGEYGATERQGSISSVRAETDVYTVDLGATATASPHGRFGTKSSVGVQYFHNFNSSTSASGQGLPPGATTASAGAIKSAGQSTSESVNLGVYGEEVLSYAERIFLTGGLRYDANSAFGENFSGVYYPKIGLSWLVTDEPWFPRIAAINSLRLRGTYGASGVQPGTTSALRYFSPIAADVVGVEQAAVTLGALGNASLQPEYSGEFETGFDLTAFQSRTSVELTYYNKKTKDALISAPVAPSLGGDISSELQNLGSIRNQGLELTLNQKLVDNSQVGFEFLIGASTNKNVILSLGPGILPVYSGNVNTQYNAPGYPLYGLWSKTWTYNDANGDGILVPSEVKMSDTASYKGPSFPTHELTVSPRLELLHRKLAIAAQFDHKDGFTKYYGVKRNACQGGASCRGLYDPTTSLDEQAATIATSNYSAYGGMMFNGEFTRFRELSVSYQLPNTLASRVHASRIAVIGTGRNLAVWTPYPGVDPEEGVGNGDQRGNEEFFGTPPLRYFTLRLNLTF